MKIYRSLMRQNKGPINLICKGWINMNISELPSLCPFCRKDHSINVLRLQITSVVRCPHCHKEYFIPYSEVQSLLKFHNDLEELTKLS